MRLAYHKCGQRSRLYPSIYVTENLPWLSLDTDLIAKFLPVEITGLLEVHISMLAGVCVAKGCCAICAGLDIPFRSP